MDGTIVLRYGTYRYGLSGNLITMVQSGAPVYDSVQLVQITPFFLWFMVPITIVNEFINNPITGGPHIVQCGPPQL